MQETNFLKLKTYEVGDDFDPFTVENANNRTVDDFASNITYTVTQQGTHQQEQDAATQTLETRVGQAETNITINQQAIGTVEATADKNKADIDGIKDDILRQDRQLDSLNESLMSVSETAQDAKTAAEDANNMITNSILLKEIPANTNFDGYRHANGIIEMSIPMAVENLSELYINSGVILRQGILTIRNLIDRDPIEYTVYVFSASITQEGKIKIVGLEKSQLGASDDSFNGKIVNEFSVIVISEMSNSKES